MLEGKIIPTRFGWWPFPHEFKSNRACSQSEYGSTSMIACAHHLRSAGSAKVTVTGLGMSLVEGSELCNLIAGQPEKLSPRLNVRCSQLNLSHFMRGTTEANGQGLRNRPDGFLRR